jgi:multisubunit Na+/H+ antiporter MnhC subunit
MNRWLPGIVMVVIGILVLFLPDLIRWVLGIGIIVVGVLNLIGGRGD